MPWIKDPSETENQTVWAGTRIAHRQMPHTREPGTDSCPCGDLRHGRCGLTDQCGQTDYSINSVEIIVNSYKNTTNNILLILHTAHKNIKSRSIKDLPPGERGT